MSTFKLSIDATTSFSGGNAPTLEILVGGVVISSAVMSSGSSSYEFFLDFTGNFPSSLSFRFDGGSGDPGDTISFDSVQVNGQGLDTGSDLTSTLVTQGQIANVSADNFLFGRVEPTSGDLGTVTHSGTGGDDDFQGTGGNDDVIDAGNGADRIRGLGGDDAINGGAGADTIFGEAGNDLIIGGTGDDILFGGAGDDLLYGQGENDYLIGGDGDDVLNGGAGNDGLLGDAGNDILFGEAGDDWLLGDSGDDILYGDAGNDTIDGGADNDTIYGGSNDDSLHGGAGNDTIYGETGDDEVTGGAGNDIIDGGSGDDLLFGSAGADTISGGDDDDSLHGGEDNDVLNGDAGLDNLNGGLGADTLNGGAGNDILRGHGLDETTISSVLFGNPNVSYSQETGNFYQLVSSSVTFAGAQGVAGSTMLNGVAGHLVTISSAVENTFVNTLAAGNDVWINASDGAVEGEWRWAGGEEDGLIFWNGDSSGSAVNGLYTNWNGGEPNNSGNEDAAEMRSTGRWNDLDGSSNTNFYVVEWSGSDFSDDNAIDTLNGGDNDDILLGNGGNDILNGDDGTDHLFGGAGNDTMSGGNANDYIYDSEGANNFYGNDGDDTLDARFQTAVLSVDDQIATYLAENANLNYSVDTGNFYEVVNNQLDWDAARSAAAATTMNGVSGHLGTITSTAEHNFIVGLAVSTNTWLGGSDDPTLTGGAEFGDWYWVEGPEAGTFFYDESTSSAVGGEFINWNPGQPNDGNNTQNYLYLLNANDAWADLVIEGDGSTGFVTVDQYLVEWEGSDVLITPPTETAQNAQYMEGGAGNDTIYGGNGSDTIYGDDLAGIETGNDFIDAGSGDDVVHGGQGNDIIYGELGSDTLNGNAGNDTIYAAFAAGASAVAISAAFDAGAESFTYADGTFGSNGTSNNYANGIYTGADGNAANGALELSLGGIDNNGITTMSGSWQRTFTLTTAMDNAELSFSYRIVDPVLDGDPFDAGEDLQLYADIDSTTYSNDANAYFLELLGTDAGATYDSGWITITLDIGALGTGSHTLSLGGLLTSKSYASEEYDIRFDDITLQNGGVSTSDAAATNVLNGGDGSDTLYGSDGTDTLFGGADDDILYSGSTASTTATLFSNTFDSDEEDLTYSDGGFLGATDPGNDIGGSYQGGDGNDADGSVQVRKTTGSGEVSGSYDGSFTVGASDVNGEITFAYRHWHANQNDNGEDSRVYFSLDGTIMDGVGGTGFISEAFGSGGATDTGWVTTTISLGALNSGQTYNFSVGLYHTGSGNNNEDAYVRIDDVLVTGLDTSVFNTLNGGDGQDDLYGSDGVDLFVFEDASAFDDIDVVYDFDTTEGDALDISDILDLAGYNPGGGDVITDFLQITDSGGDSVVRVDTTGSASFGGGTQIATIDGVTGLTDEAALVASNNVII